MTPAATSGYVPVDGTDVYFEVRGEGDPVLMIHGAFASGHAFQPLLPRLSAEHRLMTVDLQGHGRTADRNGPLTYERLADDCAAVVRRLAPEGCAVVGFSLGGGTAQQLAFRHPDLVRRLVVISAPFRQDGWHADVLVGFRSVRAASMPDFEGTEMYRNHVALAPKPDEFPLLLDKLGTLLGGHAYDWTEQVRALGMPTLIALGDADSLSPAHAAEFFALLGGGQRDGGWEGEHMSTSRLAVLPGVRHYDILESTLLAESLAGFLGESASAS